MQTIAPGPVPAIDPVELPVLSRQALTALHFGEGCLIEEYLFLRGLGLMLQPRRILEIGTSCGVGGLMLLDGASAFARQAHLTTIDAQEYDAFDANLALFPHLTNRVERIVKPSDKALAQLHGKNCRFDLVFIDGDHSADQVARDWRAVQALADRFILHDTDQMSGCREVVATIRGNGRYDVLSLSYPLGHQVFRDLDAQRRIYNGVYHQTQLVWNTSTQGPGMTLVQRRPY